MNPHPYVYMSSVQSNLSQSLDQSMSVLAISATSQEPFKLFSVREQSNLWEIPPFSIKSEAIKEEGQLSAVLSTKRSSTEAFNKSTRTEKLDQQLGFESGDTMMSHIGNCTIDQFEHRVVVLPTKEAQTGWLDTSKDYNAMCVETYGAAMVSAWLLGVFA